MKKKREKRDLGKAAPPDDGRTGASAQPDEALAPDLQVGNSKGGLPPDPDGRIVPDHQHDGREEGRPPEQAIVERAREQQNPPINPDPACADHVAEK